MLPCGNKSVCICMYVYINVCVCMYVTILAILYVCKCVFSMNVGVYVVFSVCPQK